MNLKITILGCGPSSGVPVVGCLCKVCQSPSPFNKRLRTSILITTPAGENILIDTTPDLRQQSLRAGITHLDAVLYTHTHADHCHGFDDLRPFYFSQKKSIPCWVSDEHAQEFRTRFDYAFNPSAHPGSKPEIDLKIIGQDPFEVCGLEIEPIFLPHGKMTSIGFRFGLFAYATDFKFFPKEALDSWTGKVDTMIASGLHFRPHKTHSIISETCEIFTLIQIKRGYITHMTHEVDYLEASSSLPPDVSFVFDGMTFEAPY